MSLPRNFLLAYEDRYKAPEGNEKKTNSVLFYINPFNQGAVLGKKEIESFLAQNNITPKDEYFVPCSNRTAISQLVGSLMLSYQKLSQTTKVDDLKIFLDLLSE